MRTLIFLVLMTNAVCAQQPQDLPDPTLFATNPGLSNLDSLEASIAKYDPIGTDIRGWLESVLASHLSLAPLDVSDLPGVNANIDLGIALMNSNSNEVGIISDQLLQAACDSIQHGLNTGTLDKEADDVLATIDLLMSVQYLVNIPKTDSEKLWENLENGEFSYLFTRLKTRCFIDCANGNCEPMCKVFWALVLLSLIALVLLIWYRKRLWRLLTRRKIKN